MNLDRYRILKRKKINAVGFVLIQHKLSVSVNDCDSIHFMVEVF